MALGVQKADIYGSSLTKGFDTSLRDRAFRRFRISGASNLLNQLSLGEAIDHLYEHLGGGVPGPEANTNHPYHGCPLADITAVRAGPTKLDLVVRYVRRNLSGSIPPTLAATARDTWYTTEWYQRTLDIDGQPAFFNGLPVGEVVFLNRDDPDTITGTDVPTSWSWVQAAEEIVVSTTLTNNGDSVNGLRDCTNSNSFSLAGTSYAPNTLLYLGKSRRTLNTGLTDIDFKFLHVSAGFYKQIATFTNVWNFPIGDAKERKAFNFPF